VGGLDLTQRGPDLIQGVRLAHLGVLDRTRRSWLCVQGSGAFLRRSGPTDGILEYTTSCAHMASFGTAHVLGSGVVHHAARDSRTGTVSSYCSKEVPLIQGTDSGPRAHLRGGYEPTGGAKV
jgi:hypothetical protein